jgi:hypothetical protein
MNFVCQCNISLHQVSEYIPFDECNQLIDHGFRFGKLQTVRDLKFE